MTIYLLPEVSEWLKKEELKMRKKVRSREDVLRRYPRLVAHLVAESLGYFTPRDAAAVILAYKYRRPFSCEWFLHFQKYSPGATLEDIGEAVIEESIRRRHSHKGFMNNYRIAKSIVDESINGREPVLASWF